MRRGILFSNTYTGALVNVTVNCLVLLPLGAAILIPIPIPWRGILLFGVIGLFVPAMSRFCAVAGIRRIGVSRSQSVVATSPLFSIFLAVMFLGERPSGLVLLGALAIVYGLILLSRSRAGEETWQKRDMIYPLAAGLLFAGRDVVAKVGLTHGIAPVLGGAVAATSSAVCLWIVTGIFRKRLTLLFNRESFRYLAASGFFWGLAYIFMFSALKAGHVSAVTPLIYTSPLFSAFLSLLFLRDYETVTRRVILGAVLVVLGGVGIALGR